MIWCADVEFCGSAELGRTDAEFEEALRAAAASAPPLLRLRLHP